MSLATVARWRRWTIGALIGLMGAPAAAQDRAGRIAQKLESAGVLDSYFPDVVYEVASTLAQAAPGRWQGVQVNQRPRAGWLHIYMIDAGRLPPGNLLADEGVDGLTTSDLEAGAAADEASDTIFVNTAAWKRLAAATVITQFKAKTGLIAALALVDAAKPDKVSKLWAPATLSQNSPKMKNVGRLLRGALAFVLAHEMGHLLIGRAKPSNEPDELLLSHMTNRQQDEARACPALLLKGFREKQKHEKAADLAALSLLGQQCRIGSDGKLRHLIYMLGTGWYLLAAMSEKLLAMGRHTTSPNIEKMLRARLGDQLYQEAIAARAAKFRRGAVQFAYPSSHPPDSERLRAIEAALRNTPCGGIGLDTTLPALLETVREQACRKLIAEGQAR
jgi:hypothetical protein